MSRVVLQQKIEILVHHGWEIVEKSTPLLTKLKKVPHGTLYVTQAYSAMKKDVCASCEDCQGEDCLGDCNNCEGRVHSS